MTLLRDALPPVAYAEVMRAADRRNAGHVPLAALLDKQLYGRPKQYWTGAQARSLAVVLLAQANMR